MGRVYAVASGKGGVGKTTTTVNLGAALAAAGHDVAVVDADLGMANLADAFGVDPSVATIHDVLAGEADVADATYEGAGGVSVIPGSNDVAAFAESDPEGIDDVVAALSAYDFVFLDTGASLTHVSVRPLAIADDVLLVSTTERAALRDTDRTREVTRRVGGSVAGAVLTRVDPENPNAEAVSATLDAEVLEAVPEDSEVGEATAAGEPLAVRAPDSRAAAAYRRLAAHLSGDADDDRVADTDESRDAAGGDASPDSDASTDDEREPGDDTDDERTDAAPDADETAADETETSVDSAGSEGSVERDVSEGSEEPDGTESSAEGDVSREASDPDDEANASDSSVDSDASDSDDEAGDDAVSETVLAGDSAGLVEEAEPDEATPAADSDASATDVHESSPPGEIGGVPDAESDAGGGTETTDDGDASDGDDDGEDGGGEGFLSRFLG